MDNSQIENTINQIRKRNDAVTAFNKNKNSKYFATQTNCNRVLIIENPSIVLVKNLISNILKQVKRNRSALDGRTISNELTLVEITQ